MAMIQPIAYRTHGHVLCAVSYRIYHGYRHCKRSSSRTSSPRAGPLETEARQALHMSGARAAEAFKALGLTRMLAWLGRVPRRAAGERAMYRTVVFFSFRVRATVATSLYCLQLSV